MKTRLANKKSHTKEQFSYNQVDRLNCFNVAIINWVLVKILNCLKCEHIDQLDAHFVIIHTKLNIIDANTELVHQIRNGQFVRGV